MMNRPAMNRVSAAASMKALPKRKGNARTMELPLHLVSASMKALPKRKGNVLPDAFSSWIPPASMKALPKRKGNISLQIHLEEGQLSLNESPSEKEGKCRL